MKTNRFFTVLFIMAILSASCTSSGKSSMRKIDENVPDVIKKAVMKAPKGALVGIGAARMASVSFSMDTAEMRARVEISRQVSNIVIEMVRYHAEANPDAVLPFRERMIVEISKSTISNSKIIARHIEDDGTVWVAVMVDKADAVDEINSAQLAAKNEIPSMASFDAGSHLNDAYIKIYTTKIGYKDR